jgi:TonB family protein
METFITSLLERLLATSVQTALLAAVVWALCRALPRLSPATQCWLWWLVALQVLVGLCVDPLQLPWLPQAPAAIAVASPTDLILPGAGDAAALPAGGGRSLPLWQLALLFGWLAGLAVMLRSSLREWRYSRALLANAVPCADAGIAHAVGEAATRRGLRKPPRLCMSGAVDSPLVVGQLRPVLVLPAHSSLSSAELDMAVDHELEHLRRADMLWGWVPVLARLGFFFHPLVHLAVREYGIAREAACDAAVVDGEHRSRHDYGELLLRLGTAHHGAGLGAASQTFLVLRRRLTLLQHAKFLPRAGSIAVLLIALAGVLPLRLVAAVSKSAVPDVAAVLKSDAAVEAPLPIVPEPGVPPGEVKTTKPTPQRRAELMTVAAPAVPASVPGITITPSDASPAGAGYAFMPDPQDYYPSASGALGEQGMVKLRVCYDERGKPSEVTVDQSSGFQRLDEAAIRWGKGVRFKPAVINGQSQPGCAVVPVQFSMEAKNEPQPTQGSAPATAPRSQAGPGYAFKPEVGQYYSPDSVSMGEEGLVKVRACYDTKGVVVDTAVDGGSGYARLDESAVRYAKAVRMRPAVIDGVPQPGCVVLPVQFSLKAAQPQ